MTLQPNGNIPGVVTNLAGVLPVDKEPSMTSFDVVATIRHATGIRRIGHTGTLDPFATGLLPVCIGEATKIVQFLMEGTKTYIATVRFGIETTTGDPEGSVVAEGDPSGLSAQQVAEVISQFIGDVSQVPPIYSAIKVGGKRLYEFARANIHVEIPERKVCVENIELLQWDSPIAVLRIACGKGTYIRSLVRDLGRTLNCYATLTALRRTQVGGLTIQNAVTVSEIRSLSKEGLAQRMISVDNALGHLPVVRVDPEIAWRIGVGQKLATEHLPALPAENVPFRVVGSTESTVAIAVHNDGLVRVVRVLLQQPPKSLILAVPPDQAD